MKITVIKKRYTTIYLLICGLCETIALFFMIYAINSGELSHTVTMPLYFTIVIFILLTIKFLWDIFFGMYSYTLEIHEYGIIYNKRKQKYYMKWEDVDSIMIYPNPSGAVNKSSMICFIKGREYPSRYTSIKQFNENFFGVQFRERIIYEIRKYWDKPVRGIYQVTGRNL